VVDTSDDSIAPSTPALNSGKLATEASTASDGVEEITLGGTLVVSGSVITELNKPFENTDRLVFPGIDKEPPFKPIEVVLGHVSSQVKEHLDQGTLLLVAGHEDVDVVEEYQLRAHELLDFLLWQLLLLHFVLYH
jgi:hypothetical protein